MVQRDGERTKHKSRKHPHVTFTLAEPGHLFRATLEGIEPQRVRIVTLGQPPRNDDPWRIEIATTVGRIPNATLPASDLVAAYSRSAPARRPGSSMSAMRDVSPRLQWRPTASGRAKCRLRRLVRFLHLLSQQWPARKWQSDRGQRDDPREDRRREDRGWRTDHSGGGWAVQGQPLEAVSEVALQLLHRVAAGGVGCEAVRLPASRVQSQLWGNSLA